MAAKHHNPESKPATAVIGARVPVGMKNLCETAALLYQKTTNDILLSALQAYFDNLPKDDLAEIERMSNRIGKLKAKD